MPVKNSHAELTDAERSEAVTLLYHESVDSLKVNIAKLLEGRNLAVIDDIIQETFTRIYLSYHQFNPQKSKPVCWVLAIARNVTFRTLEKESRLIPDPNLFEGPKMATALSMAHLDVSMLTNKLNSQQRTLITLKYIHGFTHAEMAVILNKPLGSIKSADANLHLKLRKLSRITVTAGRAGINKRYSKSAGRKQTIKYHPDYIE